MSVRDKRFQNVDRLGHSSAREIPTTRGKNQLEQASGTTPRLEKTKPKRACSEASRMSMGRVIDGLRRGRRQYVHLSPDRETATKVGARRGRPVILTIDSAAMHADGYLFYRADNGVWLTDHVPSRYISGWE